MMSALRLRTVALLSAGALALHQLRYLLAHGQETGTALAREGHGYLGALAPLIAIAVGATVLQFLVVVRCRRGERPYRVSWRAMTAVLLAVFTCQESLEGVLASGHATGMAAIVGSGGWVAIPLAAAVGAAVSLLMKGAERAVVRSQERDDQPRVGPSITWIPTSAVWTGASPLASSRAGRAPPAFS